MDDLARLLAYEEIRRIVARYALALDTRDLDALVDLFVADVRVGRDRSGTMRAAGGSSGASTASGTAPSRA